MKLLMFFHNVFLTLLSLYMCVKILYEAYTHKYVPPRRRHPPTLLPVAPARRPRRRARPASQPASQLPSPSGRAWLLYESRAGALSAPRTTLTRRTGGTGRSYTLWGNAYDPSHKAMAELIWVFYVSKIYEFMDTFIMILKGNTHQVTTARCGRIRSRRAVAFCPSARAAYMPTRAHPSCNRWVGTFDGLVPW